jgi:hypothetical protein
MTKPTRLFWLAAASLSFAAVAVLIWRLQIKTDTGITIHRVPPIIDTFGQTNSSVSGLKTNGG